MEQTKRLVMTFKTTDDKKVKQLIKILGDYELKPKFDEQMNELYHMGYADKTIR